MVGVVDVEGFYQGLAAQGLGYAGPFQAVVGIAEDPADPDTVVAEIALPADTDVTGYGIHPALLDAALHPLSTLSTPDPTGPRLPFALTGITLHATAATHLHVRLTRTSTDTYTLHASDPTGAPVITVSTVMLRALSDTPTPQPTLVRDGLFGLHWPALPADTFPPAHPAPSWALITPDPTHLPPELHHLPTYPDLTHPDLATADLVIWTLPTPTSDDTPLDQVHQLTTHTLAQLQHWLTRPDTLHTHLAILTHHAITTDPHDPTPNLAHAATWALIHTTQNEHPTRITALDTDHTPTPLLTHILAALPHSEPQLALRQHHAHTPRLTPVTATPGPAPVWDPEGTVLITGGTGMLGALFAEHLITNHGMRHLLLVSRRGPATPGADELTQRLTKLGAQLTITACDTSNPAELAAVLEAIPDQHRLTAIIHAAGVLDDAVVTELTANQLHTVLAAKADAAWHLHHLTADRDLAAFVLFSSASATLGNPGQANYAAANAVLDALAHHRPEATSLAWGYWQSPSGMTAHLNNVDQARVTRTAWNPITPDHGLALFDTALTTPTPPCSRPH
ncbi:SDR family oxidoreductase [Mycobacterium szulgai]|uniref:SDR family oxidoreductase n=1 Tax=Mycobacterium szulgai TaxID=1787 RepID=UPI0021F29D4D|nr:SDR family oxidoreductase [Mycobacterium szulgai]